MSISFVSLLFLPVNLQMSGLPRSMDELFSWEPTKYEICTFNILMHLSRILTK